MRRLAILFALLAPLALAGCDGMAPGGGSGSQPVRAMPLYGGSVVVRGPQGYCVDPASRKRQTGGTLVFLGSCEALSGQPGFRVEPALMIVSVSPRRPGTSQPSSAALVAAMAPKEPLATFDEDGLAMVHFNTGGAIALPGGDRRYWRGGMALNGHLVSLAVYAPEGSAIAGPSGRAMLQALATEIRRASAAAQARPASSAQDAETTRKKPRGLGGLLGGLFPNSG